MSSAATLREIRTETGLALSRVRRAPWRWRAEMVSPCDQRGAVRRSRPMRCARARRSAREGSGAARGPAWRLSLPGRRRGAECGERVVTGARSGLRASGGKGIAKKIAREALVTAWYGAATTELPPAAWSADADVGASRRNQVPYRDPSRCRAGRRPAPGTTGHSEAEAGPLKPNGEAAAVRDLTDRCGDRGTPRSW